MVTVSDDNTDDESKNASTQTISCIDIQRYRSLEKAIRVTAYVLRFIQNLRNSKDKRSIGFISVEERCKALKVLIVTVQQETFKDEIESLNSSSQKKVPLDSQVTASIIQDVMDKIREINTTDIKFHVWSDNAGCYKSTEMLSFLFHSGLTLSYDFCESQNGKGPCDRTAATIKSSIRRYVNQGHDVLTAQSMKKAIDKSAKNVK
ncbi:unnamed protein product [Mytilus edulis]|uniref:Uncharacterized protein n=1 Tax=Mytilus edulis TaxID=6550 RepID=A0A8S3S7D2_MYTED|nr:unnamed protein product [Mytilus edulis]